MSGPFIEMAPKGRFAAVRRTSPCARLAACPDVRGCCDSWPQSEALGNEAVTAAHAAQLADIANRFRVVFEAAHDGDTDRAANERCRLLPDTHACPQLDLTEPGWNLHFHGADDTLADGWAAGCASGLALAIGSDLAGRIRVCAAPAFDRVFVDVARNAQRRFCSPQCQSRVKAAAHRARKAAS